MRHFRTRKRYRFILIFLLAVSFILFFESRVESFAPQLKSVIESQIETLFGGKFTLSIGDMDGGILRPFILNNVKIRDKGGSPILSFIEIKRIRSDYRIWDILKKKKSGVLASGTLSAHPRIYINFVTRNKEIEGFLKFEGNAENADIKGYLILLNEKKVDFSGRIKAGSFELEFQPAANCIFKISGVLSDTSYIVTSIKVNHFKLEENIDIVCDAVIKNSITRDASDPTKDHLEGELEVKSFILNYVPFYDIKASYKIRSGILEISDLALGSDFKVRGRMSLRGLYSMNIIFLADNANLNKALSYLGAQKDSVISGILNGKFEIKGPIKKLKTIARIEIRKGFLAGLDFDYLTATLKGEGPIIRIEDSRITRPSGYFTLAGEMDFRKLGKPAIFQDIKLVSDDKAINWDMWAAEKSQGVKEIKMSKKMSDEVNLGFKKFIQDDKVDESVRDRDEFELEYKVHPNESLKMLFGKDKDFFGLEHKDKF